MQRFALSSFLAIKEWANQLLCFQFFYDLLKAVAPLHTLCISSLYIQRNAEELLKIGKKFQIDRDERHWKNKHKEDGTALFHIDNLSSPARTENMQFLMFHVR